MAKKPKGKWTVGRNKADNGDRVALAGAKAAIVVLDNGDWIISIAAARIGASVFENRPAVDDGSDAGMARIRLSLAKPMVTVLDPDPDEGNVAPDDPELNPDNAFDEDEIDAGN